ncbi:DUF4199 domain-containing protein [Pedobacter sp. MW01-1-1]|uniref:DUF4199 domain-containing protein n=1 Tax=Pedobacter sp. MW01-1-1 TaxID=3383027 RepID=UPI003FEFCEEB
MKKIVFLNGLYAGLIAASVMLLSISQSDENTNYDTSMYLGFGAMLVGFIFIFVGIKQYRDQLNGGIVSFGKGFLIGFYISFIASTIYVVAWLIDFHFFVPDYMDRFTEHMLNQARKEGLSAAAMAEKTKEMDHYKALYKNPLMIILYTYMEILPVGILISFLSALILKRKTA